MSSDHEPRTHEEPRSAVRSFLAPLQDLSFRTELFPRVFTPAVAKVVYVVAIVVAVLGWLGGAAKMIVGGALSLGGSTMHGHLGAHRMPGHGPAMIAVGVLDLLFGWILALLFVVVVRMVLEMILRLSAPNRPRSDAN